jgi:T4 RnlA family RNA ligase
MTDDFTPLETWLNVTLNEDQRNSINVRRKDDFYLYNYKDVVATERDDPVIVKCRGLVLKGDGTVMARPFDRFFNEGEPCATKIDWSSAVALEKLDGTLVNLWWSGAKWEVTTRGSFYPREDLEEAFDVWFNSLFKGYVYLGTSEYFKEFTYMFELISSKNRIVTKYDCNFVALLGIRNNRTGKELSWNHVALMAVGLDARFPCALHADEGSPMGVERVLNDIKTQKTDFEGYVVVDKDFNRLKIKSETYKKLARIKMLNDEDIYTVARDGSEKIGVDPSYLDAFPEVKDKVEFYRDELASYYVGLMRVFEQLKPLLKKSRKDYALEAVKFVYFKGPLFHLADGRTKFDVNYKIFKGWMDAKNEESTAVD